MRFKTRNILLIFGFFGLIVIGVLAYGIYSAYSFMTQFGMSREIPEEIKDARVLKGQEILERKEFYKLTKDGILKTIGDGSKIRDEKERERVVKSQTAKGIYNFSDLKIIGEEIVAVGQFGGFVFDFNGNLKRQILFEPDAEKLKIGPYEQNTYQSNLDNLRIVKLDTDKIGFLSYGISQGARIFDDSGNEVWSVGKEDRDLGKLLNDEKNREADFEKRVYVMEATVGDLDGDSISEYIVTRKNDGIRAYKQDGQELWFEADNFPYRKLDVLDLDGDGKNELLEIGKCVRDGNGKIVREIKGGLDETYVLVEDKAHKKELQFVDIFDGKLSYSGEDGTKIFESPAPLSEIKKNPEKVDIPGHPEMSYTDDAESVYQAKAVWVKLAKDKPKYLAVIASFIGLPRANLYVYAPGGTLVYHELLDEDAETITMVPNADGTEVFLIGGKDTIWRYSGRG